MWLSSCLSDVSFWVSRPPAGWLCTDCCARCASFSEMSASLSGAVYAAVGWARVHCGSISAAKATSLALVSGAGAGLVVLASDLEVIDPSSAVRSRTF